MRRVFRARGKLVGTSDFVVTKGYVQIRVSPTAARLARRGLSVGPCLQDINTVTLGRALVR